MLSYATMYIVSELQCIFQNKQTHTQFLSLYFWGALDCSMTRRAFVGEPQPLNGHISLRASPLFSSLN